MTTREEPSLERYRRLDDFLKRRLEEVYAEPPSEMHTGLTREMFASVAKVFPLPPGARVLDVGCGQGAALELFAAAGLDAVGVTLGDDVAACRAKGLNAVEMDLAFLDFPNGGFDLVWCRHALEHSIFPFFTLSEMHRVLKPGGGLYLEVPAPDTAARHETNPNHYSVLGKAMWIALVGRAGFQDIRVRDINLTTQAGPDVYWAFLAGRPA